MYGIRWTPCVALPLVLLILLPPSPAIAQAQGHPGRLTLGVVAGVGVGGSPLSHIAERNGTFAVPGTDWAARVVARTPGGAEWTLGVLGDGYHLDQAIDIDTRSAFDYTSTGLFVGYGVSALEAGLVPVRYGAELGWRWYRVESDGFSYYDGKPLSGSFHGSAFSVAFSAGIEFRLMHVSVMPRVRVETNYPTFGGGDGYSVLHRESDLGIRASLGVDLKTSLFRIGGSRPDGGHG